MAVLTATVRRLLGYAFGGEKGAAKEMCDKIDVLAAATPGTGAASQALVLDANGNVTMPTAGQFALSRASIAAAGSQASDSTALTGQVNVVTAADGATGVQLPAAAVAIGPILVINTVQTAALLVYPVSGGNDNINGLAEDLPITIGPGKAVWFVPISATQWYCDNSNQGGRINTTAASLTLTLESHGDRVITQNRAAGTAFTLPAAVGSGRRITIVVGTTISGGSLTVVRAGADVIRGVALADDGDGEPANGWSATAATTITFEGSTQGGISGDRIELIDIASGVWSAMVICTQTGAEATPFS